MKKRELYAPFVSGVRPGYRSLADVDPRHKVTVHGYRCAPGRGPI
ncbi:MAG: hypothetical protein V7709_09110 [Halioglobus sp.]